MSRHNSLTRLTFFVCLLTLGSYPLQAQTTSFSYQGKLTDGGNPANGTFDLQFVLFDNVSGGAQQGATATREDVAVTNGVFTVQLDFGANAFPGAARFLELSVRPGASVGAFTLLTPRQPVQSTPYAIQSLNAATATTAGNFSGALAGDVTGTQTATALANNAVTTAKLADGSVTAAKHADGSVTDAKIVTVSGSKVTGSLTTATLPGANVTGAVANATNAVNATNATTAVNFSGALAGDVTGNQGTTTVGKLRNLPLPTPVLADNGKVLRYKNDGVNPASFELAADANSGGTITGVAAGTGLSGGGTSGTVTVGIAAGGVSATELATNAVTTAKLADGSVTDAKIATVAGSKITGTIPVAGVPAGSTNYIQNSAILQASSNFNISGNGFIGGSLGIGTTAPAAKLEVGGDIRSSALRQELNVNAPPNVINGFMGTGSGGAMPGNRVTAGVVGASIGGGGFNGALNFPGGFMRTGDNTNRVTDWFGTVGGGFNNTASSSYATVGGGDNNNASGQWSMVGGGTFNTASGSGATVPGGNNNTASGQNSFAAGKRAKANHVGAFVWGGDDGTTTDFASTAPGQFLIRAIGNVGINTNAPLHTLHVNGTSLLGEPGGVYGYSIAGASPGPYPSLGFNAFYSGSSYLAGVTGYGGVLQFQDGDGKFGYYSTSASTLAGAAHTFVPRLVINSLGNVGIGTATPSFLLHVVGNNNIAILGESTNNTGVLGSSNSDKGVFGSSTSDSGVYGQTVAVSLSKAGVYGVNSGSGGIGVIGEASVGNATGVFGVSASSTGFGMYGRNLFGGYAGFFEGKVRVTGVIEKPGGGFKIDHPLDPENKYLVHSFVESPDMKNLYDGTVTTDASGAAEITLPDWFAALNRDFRYQLTCIGVFAQAIIAEEIKDNRFKIRTSLPNVKVSWQVTGTRQDAWANQNRLPVEEAKPAVERGFYQNPAAFGQPEERSLEWAIRPAQMKEQKEAREKAARGQNNKTAAPAARPHER